jgi:hypothetical protein
MDRVTKNQAAVHPVINVQMLQELLFSWKVKYTVRVRTCNRCRGESCNVRADMTDPLLRCRPELPTKMRFQLLINETERTESRAHSELLCVVIDVVDATVIIKGRQMMLAMSGPLSLSNKLKAQVAVLVFVLKLGLF